MIPKLAHPDNTGGHARCERCDGLFWSEKEHGGIVVVGDCAYHRDCAPESALWLPAGSPPEPMTDVLCWWATGHQRVGLFRDGSWYVAMDGTPERVPPTHWRPLPDGPMVEVSGVEHDD